jgi:hypothetical protein
LNELFYSSPLLVDQQLLLSFEKGNTSSTTHLHSKKHEVISIDLKKVYLLKY